MDDTITSDDVQDDTSSDPNKRSWFITLIYYTFQVIVVDEQRLPWRRWHPWSQVRRYVTLTSLGSNLTTGISRLWIISTNGIKSKKSLLRIQLLLQLLWWYSFGSFVTTGNALFSSLYPILADHPSESFWYFYADLRTCRRNITPSRNWISIFRHKWSYLSALRSSVQNIGPIETSQCEIRFTQGLWYTWKPLTFF